MFAWYHFCPISLSFIHIFLLQFLHLYLSFAPIKVFCFARNTIGIIDPQVCRVSPECHKKCRKISFPIMKNYPYILYVPIGIPQSSFHRLPARWFTKFVVSVLRFKGVLRIRIYSYTLEQKLGSACDRKHNKIRPLVLWTRNWLHHYTWLVIYSSCSSIILLVLQC